MPNGHGGYFRFGSALVLLIVLGTLYFYYLKSGSTSLAWAGYPFAAALGWRFAYGLHMWRAAEYGGAYTTNVAWTTAMMKYLAGSVAYALAAMAGWYGLT